MTLSQALALYQGVRERPVSHSPNRVFFFFHRAFSDDVTSAILENQNNKTVAMLVFPTNHVGIVSYVNFFYNFFQQICITADHENEEALFYNFGKELLFRKAVRLMPPLWRSVNSQYYVYLQGDFWFFFLVAEKWLLCLSLIKCVFK